MRVLVFIIGVVLSCIAVVLFIYWNKGLVQWMFDSWGTSALFVIVAIPVVLFTLFMWWFDKRHSKPKIILPLSEKEKYKREICPAAMEMDLYKKTHQLKYYYNNGELMYISCYNCDKKYVPALHENKKE